MWYIPEPKLHELWCIKGFENKADASFYELTEKRKDADGSTYYLVNGRTNVSLGWFGLEYLRKHYAPWNDPWKAQRAWAKKYGFTFKEE